MNMPSMSKATKSLFAPLLAFVFFMAPTTKVCQAQTSIQLHENRATKGAGKQEANERQLVHTSLENQTSRATPEGPTRIQGATSAERLRVSLPAEEVRSIVSEIAILIEREYLDAPEDTPRPPGRLVDLGGYKLHLHCTGSGDPTVVLVAGAGDFSFDWSLVQVSASHKTRVCSYDRAGLAWSDVGPLPRTMRQDAYELHRLLELAGVKAPYVLVGHSAGGLLVRVYAMEYPEDVAGLVLVDPTHEDTTLMYQGKIVRVRDSSKGRPIPAPQTMYSNPPKQPTKEERKQYLQMFGPPQIKLPFNRLSSEAQRWRRWALSARNPGAEWDDSIWADELEALGRARAMTKLPLADRPLVVLVADKGWPPTGEEQKRLAEEKRAQKLGLADLSSRARTVLIDKSGHHIQLEAPDVVVEAISEVVAFVLGPRALASALDTFKGALDERWSYRYANGADFDMPIAALRKRLDVGISLDEFGIQLQKIIALGIDGHSRVSGYRLPPGGRLPFLIEAEGERFVAFNPERSAFLANGFPFLTKIDGKPVAEWCTAASVLVPKGSPQYVRHRCLLHLRELDYWRGELDLPKKDVVEIELADQDDRARKTLTLPVSQSLPAHGVWPPGGSRLLDGNIGYLRLASMQKATSVTEIKQWMPRFRDSTGLIVDVRDNNGGERDALLLLYSYLAGPDHPSRVFTAAAYRLHEKHKENHLAENHFMYRARDRKWTTKERQAIAEFAKNFKPEWELPRGQFSEWHYLALNRSENRDLYHYDKPVIVLINAKCFSATDIFLNGLKGMKNVVLLGTPSSGGSAFTQEIMLGVTPLRLRIGSMASFQADGKLFDRNGIHPDVLLEPVPEYYIGGRDNQLEEAVKRIRNR